MLRPLLCTLFLVSGAMLKPQHGDYGNYYYYEDDYSDEQQPLFEPCNSTSCLAPDCSCFGKHPPGGMHLNDVPQFVMLTFDDAVNPVNIETYRNVRGSRKNSGNMCPITATFFVTHEYNDYTLVNELYREGHEIAVHSISHESNTEMWKYANETRWRNEMWGMKKILSNIANIPESEIVGHRAPFLQTAGDTTFKVLKENGFSYDSSLPSRSHIDPPLWPYTLDYGYPQDCQIEPCPSKSYPGFWEFPMVQWKRSSAEGIFHCSMLDACTPQPESKADTVRYFRNNFNRHYQSNKAPFPVFLHEAWLRDAQGRHSKRYDGLLAFLDEILAMEDVFVVSVKEVLDYMKGPLKLREYKAKKCSSEDRKPALPCKDEVVNCYYKGRRRYMKSCVPCPERYPWIGNPFGRI